MKELYDVKWAADLAEATEFIVKFSSALILKIL